MMLILSREEDLIPYVRDLNQQVLMMGGKNSLLIFCIYKTYLFQLSSNIIIY